MKRVALLYMLVSERANIMDSKTSLYLFYGYGSEYSLAPLADRMREQGYEVLEIDILITENVAVVLSSVKGRRIVFLTSWHLFFDKKNFNRYTQCQNVLSPLEVMEYLSPLRSVFYPHDLECFLHASEVRWIDLFDMVLLPFKNNDYFQLKKLCCDVSVVGWIKKTDTKKIDTSVLDGKDAVYLPSNLTYMLGRHGIEDYVSILERFLPKTVAFKFARTEETKILNQMLSQKGYVVLCEDMSLFDFLDQVPFVIGNGISSIIYEASLSGKTTISVLDGAQSDSEYLNKLDTLNAVYPMHLEDVRAFLEVNAGGENLKAKSSSLRSFTFEDVIAKIVI